MIVAILMIRRISFDFYDDRGIRGFSSFDANSGFYLLLGINYVCGCDDAQNELQGDDVGASSSATLNLYFPSSK